MFGFSLVFSEQGNSLVFRVFSAVFLCFSRGFLGFRGGKNSLVFWVIFLAVYLKTPRKKEDQGKVSRDMGYRSDSIAVSRDMGPLSWGTGVARARALWVGTAAATEPKLKNLLKWLKNDSNYMEREELGPWRLGGVRIKFPLSSEFGSFFPVEKKGNSVQNFGSRNRYGPSSFLSNRKWLFGVNLKWLEELLRSDFLSHFCLGKTTFESLVSHFWVTFRLTPESHLWVIFESLY